MLLELKFSGAAHKKDLWCWEIWRGGMAGWKSYWWNLGSATTASSFLPEENWREVDQWWMTLVLLFTQLRCYTTQNTHTAVLCRVISLQKESILHCTNNPVCACFYKAESEKEKGWDKHMLFRNQLDSLDNDSSCMGNKPSCDWCGSISQYNTA